ncbi:MULTISPECIES: DUF3488 and transglutaminase-like domain-containing protein [unclassified Pseudoalteromonas]|uniref:transglutaminase TgpA family protein n=1 Tax=unclassified Pseudoalteromonas TaxID=194690 RepID=UPI000C07E009|nr:MULTISPECIES: DUF3488 and transglutaminase-like domain-containing protein [unclassified Pseudoalteromonas]MDP2634666.1 DUF3488 and transglutaminase-like domain-containing protein [Pseudoalteromonas sp. 1_MG-2023]PHN91201.1 transglutaminase [Pseudoalteromonas sp. 3D05]
MQKHHNEKSINISLSIIYGIVVLFLMSELTPVFSALLAILCVWNFTITIMNKPKPSTLYANILAGFSLVLLLYEIGFGDTVTLFVAMLILSSLFKLLQAKTKKNYQTIVLLSFFSLSTVYLFSQSIMATLCVSALYVFNFAALALIESKHSLKIASKQSGKMLLLALPVAVFLLLFLPKLPAFWQLPGPKLAKTGLSESVNPFDIAKLSRSDELVFRAKLSKNNPPAPPYYWRAIIHDKFDGHTWLVSDFLKSQQRIKKPVSNTGQFNSQYTIIAEPSSQPWLYGIGQAYSPNSDVKNTEQGLLIRKRYLSNNINYDVKSSPLNAPQLDRINHYQNLTLANSEQYNVQSQQLALSLYEKNNSDSAFVTALTEHFLNKGFAYTLTPEPMTGNNTIDEFMFNNKRGFCGHYASAAAFMFRTVGIPARVVSGYLGGELNKQDEYLSVYQYDAHAWVEVYIKDKGWQIFDATAVVSPERLNGSLSQMQSLNNEFTNNLDFSLLRFNQIPGFNWLRLNLENLDYKWTNWVLGFDQQKQSSFLKRLFGNSQLWKISLFVILSIVIIFISYFVYLNWPKKTKIDEHLLVKHYKEIQLWCAKNGFDHTASQTPLHYLNLASEHFAEKGSLFLQFAQLYSDVRYKGDEFTQQRKKHSYDLVKSIKTKAKRSL